MQLLSFVPKKPSRMHCVLKSITIIDQCSCSDFRNAAMIYLICSSCGSNPPSLGAWYQHNPSLNFTRRFLINTKKIEIFFLFFFHDRNFYFPFKILSLQSTQTQLSCYFQRPLMEFSGKLRLLTLCRTGPQSWKEIAWHLVQPTNVLVHSCTVIDLTSF